MTKKIRKLQLNKETVQRLDAVATQHAADAPRDAASRPARCETDYYTCAC
jgi:hypothetical protein